MNNLSRFEKNVSTCVGSIKCQMLVKGRGEVAVASCNCNTKLRKVKECCVRLVVSKQRPLTVVRILQLLPRQGLVIAALLPPKSLVSPRSGGCSPALSLLCINLLFSSGSCSFHSVAALAVRLVAVHVGAKHHMLVKTNAVATLIRHY